MLDKNKKSIFNKMKDKWAGKETPCSDLNELNMAIATNDYSLFLQLLPIQTNINQEDGTGRIPLFLAVKNGRREMVAALIRKGADVNFQNENLQTPIFLAAEWNLCLIFKDLMLAGSDLLLKDERGKSCLEIAEAESNHEILSIYQETKILMRNLVEHKRRSDTKKWGS